MSGERCQSLLSVLRQDHCGLWGHRPDLASVPMSTLKMKCHSPKRSEVQTQASASMVYIVPFLLFLPSFSSLFLDRVSLGSPG